MYSSISIGTKTIGDNAYPYIVAEVGSNWWNLPSCIEAIRLAKLAGADAVKFQLFSHSSLYGMAIQSTPGQNPYLDATWLPDLKNACKANEVEFLCSAFSPEIIDVVDPFVSAHKVASAELSHVRMLQKLAQIRKPVILSVGASGFSDIQQALDILGNVPTILLYCVSSYPAREVDLEGISVLQSHFGRPVGFSDHSLDICNLPKFAVQYYGAVLVEKHFTPESTLSTPDVAHSLDYDQFGRMVKSIRRRSVFPGSTVDVSDRVHAYSREERDMIVKHNRRLIATQTIYPGQKFIEGQNFGIYRSLKEDTHAYSPFVLLSPAHSPADKTAKKKIEVGEGIGPGDF